MNTFSPGRTTATASAAETWRSRHSDAPPTDMPGAQDTPSALVRPAPRRVSQRGTRSRFELALDTEPRELDVPVDLAAALSADKVAGDAFSKLSYSARKRHVLSVAGAETPGTRQRRLPRFSTSSTELGIAPPAEI
jgi:bacteriocin resistance YdeI/OmpD-like protein